ncbi:MAG TPA: hypothetical protein DD399_06785, partial [Alcanivorax sp.]|nr:hypothetical protein [Alcanivorax sp.]
SEARARYRDALVAYLQGLGRNRPSPDALKGDAVP